MQKKIFFAGYDVVSHNKLKEWSKKKLENSYPNWILKIQHFLKNWFSDSKTIIVQTSGTVTAKKKLLKKKKHFIFSAKESLDYLGIKKGQKAILCLSADYIAGQLMIIRALIGELDLYCINPDANPLERIQKSFPLQQFNLIAVVPYQLFSALEMLKNISHSLIGGDFLPDKIKTKLKNFPNSIYETFGMAETLTHIALKKINTTTNPDLFITLASVKINQAKNGTLRIKSPRRGLKNYLETKDIIKIYTKNSFEYLGRLDYIIQTGSMKIQPEILEKKFQKNIPLLQHKNFFLDSVPHPQLNSQLILCVEGSLSKKEKQKLHFLFKEKLEFYEIPKKIFFLPKFIFSENMKILRKETKKIIIK